MLSYFKKLQKEDNRYGMLELAYSVIAIVSIFIAGIIALFNQSLGVSLLVIPLVAAAACVLNVMIWSLTKLVADAIRDREAAKKANK